MVFSIARMLIALCTLSACSSTRVARAHIGGRSVALPTPSRVAVSRASPLASDTAREQERRSSRTLTIDKTDAEPVTERKQKVEKEPIWRVLLHNDDVHTFDYVSMAICKVVKTVSRKKAYKITIECHLSGMATVTTTWKQMAKQYCTGLQKMGLTSSIAPDPSMTQ